MLQRCGAKVVQLREPEDLEGVEGLVLPGGESTALRKMMVEAGLKGPLNELLKQGVPCFGTCAGAILLAKQVDGKRGFFSVLDAKVSRNAYGRQVDSFETTLTARGLGKVRAVFIRAPIIESVSPNVQVLASFQGKPVLVRQGKILAATFHPELTSDMRVHKYFLKMLS